MIDFHTHILPGIDDGSPDLPETVRLLKEELRQGVARIIATPHFYAGKATVQEFLTNIPECRRSTEKWRNSA